MDSPSHGPSAPRRLRDVLFDDVKWGGIGRDYRRDLRDIFRFYLNEEQRERLAKMGRVKRFFRVAWWLIRNLLLKLPPHRRLMLLVAFLVFAFRLNFEWQGTTFDFDFSNFGFLLVVVVLMLELKDKLLARDEIEVARKVQESLLPTSHPRPPGWEVWSATTPANDVGGDLIDYLEGSHGRLGLALGDVAGKGMGAALLCAKLQATLRALAPQAANLEMLGTALNGILERSGIDNRYATLFYAEIAPGLPDVLYLNAGHNPGLLVSNGAIASLEASSLPLGMLPGVAYTQGTASMSDGDVLVLYSDGITEATNAAGVEFGLDRLKAAVGTTADRSAEQIARGILGAASVFLDAEKPHDDQSILVLRRVSP
jgi:phosphoserine phosphatase RsbU/P